MSEKIEFKMLDYECIDKDVVTFRLEDGALVKIKVDIDRAGVATNYKNSDGTPHYLVNASIKVKIIPNDKTFIIEKKQIKPSNTPYT